MAYPTVAATSAGGDGSLVAATVGTFSTMALLHRLADGTEGASITVTTSVTAYASYTVALVRGAGRPREERDTRP